MAVCGDQIAGSVPEGMMSSGTVIAYEPLWAIGSGNMPTPGEITEVHAHIRRCLAVRLAAEGNKVRILYGGSVKPANARAILALPEVGGVLVGGASLNAVDFEAIFRAVSNHGLTARSPFPSTDTSYPLPYISLLDTKENWDLLLPDSHRIEEKSRC